MRKLAGHVDDVNLVVANDAQMFDQPLGVHHLAAADDACEVGVEAPIAQAHRRGGQWGDDDFGCASGDLPQRDRARFLDLRMRREILEGQHIVGGQPDDGVRRKRPCQVSQRTDDRQQLIDGAVVIDDDDQRPGDGAMKQRIEESFAGWSESRYTYSPRAALELGLLHAKSRYIFHVREEFANER